MGSSPSASVVVCAYSLERWPWLEAALSSVQAQQEPPLELIVVIDHNPALETAVAERFPGVRVLPNVNARGLSGARNTGVASARGEVIAFLDDDAVAEAGWLAKLRVHYGDETVAGVGGRAEPIWPDERPIWFPEEFDWIVGCSHRGLPDRTAEIRNLIGCNMSFRKSVFERVGGFNEALGRRGADGAGGEETELCIRARRAIAGARILYDPAIVVRHRVTAERASWRYFRRRALAEGRSKARMVAELGSDGGLSAERDYLRRTLPAALGRAAGDVARGRFAAGGSRAAAIVFGVGCVAGSYLWARFLPRPSAQPERAFLPLRVVDIDLAKPLPAIGNRDEERGLSYGSAFCLLRWNGRPVGTAELPFENGTLTPEALTRAAADIPLDDPPAPAAASTDAPLVSVVLATHDRPASLSACLDTLLRQDHPNYEIIVVDNAPSSPATAELVQARSRFEPRLRYLREDRPGLGHAHNCGVAQARGAVVAFTDDDVLVDRTWLSSLAASFEADPMVGCVTGLILPARLDTRAQYWIERHGGFGKGFARLRYDLRDNRPPGLLFPYAAGSFGSGANMAFRRAALDRIGGFDPALGAGTKARGGDDLAAFTAVVLAGYRLVYEPAALVWHHHRPDEAGMRKQAFGYGMGLGAFLTKQIVDRPATLGHFVRAVPAAARHMLGRSSPKIARLPADYPRSLVWRERLGMIAGIGGYLRSRASLPVLLRRRPLGGTPSMG